MPVTINTIWSSLAKRRLPLIVAVIVLLVLWLRKRRHSKVITDKPIPVAGTEKSCSSLPTETKKETIEDVQGTAEGAPKSKRQEKRERRKEQQRERDIREPLVRTTLTKYKAFVDQCAAVGISVDEDFIERQYPKRFESHNHVVVVQLNTNSPTAESTSNNSAAEASNSVDPSVAVQKEIFQAIVVPFAKSLATPTDVVVIDVQGIDGELRKPIHEVLWHSDSAATSAEKCFAPIRSAAPSGKYADYVPSVTFTTHVENKTRYSFDVMRVMFSSGNTEIRMHFGTIEAKDEIVVDMFAGIGYFTLPLAIHGKPRMIHALEKNPDSAAYLQMNAYQNGVADRITVYCGDNREVAGTSLDGQCDRVLMGYIPSCKEFIPKAVQFLKKRLPLPSADKVAQYDSNSPSKGRKGKKAAHKGEEEVVEEGTPAGVIHYHYLAGKDDAEAVALADIASGVPTGLVANVDYKVTRIFQVKSYRPKVWHYVADVTFGK